MNRIFGVLVQEVAVLMPIDGTDRPEDCADQSLFAEGWAARHNAELWRTGPSGMYNSAAVFAPANTAP